MIDTNWEEHYIKRGDPTKPTYYIIRYHSESVGLFFRVALVTGHIRHALSKGWLPVVDMQNYPNPYLAPEKLGKENSWEYYFEQPLRVGLEQAYAGENIVLSSQNPVCGRPSSQMRFYENKEGILTEWRMIRKLGLLKVKQNLLKEIAIVQEKMLSSNDRVLGVHLRGTDYSDNNQFSIPIPPPLEFAISTIVNKMEEWQCNKIFLATEDKGIVRTFKQVFGNLCFTFDKTYLNHKAGQIVTTERINRENDHFLQGKDYLMDMALLSVCNSFIAARCAGTVGVMLLADNFEHTYFFNLGRYGMITLD